MAAKLYSKDFNALQAAKIALRGDPDGIKLFMSWMWYFSFVSKLDCVCVFVFNF